MTDENLSIESRDPIIGNLVAELYDEKSKNEYFENLIDDLRWDNEEKNYHTDLA